MSNRNDDATPPDITSTKSQHEAVDATAVAAVTSVVHRDEVMEVREPQNYGREIAANGEVGNDDESAAGGAAVSPGGAGAATKSISANLQQREREAQPSSASSSSLLLPPASGRPPSPQYAAAHGAELGSSSTYEDDDVVTATWSLDSEGRPISLPHTWHPSAHGANHNNVIMQDGPGSSSSTSNARAGGMPVSSHPHSRRGRTPHLSTNSVPFNPISFVVTLLLLLHHSLLAMV